MEDIGQEYVRSRQVGEMATGDYADFLETQAPFPKDGFDAQYIIERNLEVPEKNELTEGDLQNFNNDDGQRFINASRILYDFMKTKPKQRQRDTAEAVEQFREDSPQSAQYMRGLPPGVGSMPTDDGTPQTNQQFAQYGLELGGQLEYNFSNLGFNAARLTEMDDTTKSALYVLMNTYEKLPYFTWNGTKRFVKGVMTDPATILGLGTLGFGFLGQAGLKQATRKGLLAAIKASLKSPYAIAAIEGGAYGGLDDAFRQRIKIMAGAQPEGFRPGQSALATGIGTVAGPAIVGAGQGVVKGVSAARDRIRARMQSRQRLNQRLDTRGGVLPTEQSPGMPTTARQGEMFAGRQMTPPPAPAAARPDELGFRSGLIRMLDELPEAASGQQILSTLSNENRLGQYGAKKSEIELLGLPEFLQGKQRVTKQELQDFIQSKRVRMRGTDEGGGIIASEAEPGDNPTYYSLREMVDANDQGLNRHYMFGMQGDDIVGSEVTIEGRLPLDNLSFYRKQLNELDTVIRNDEIFYVQPGDADYDPEYAKRFEGQEISYIRPEIQNALDDFEAEYSDISNNGNRVNLNLRGSEQDRLSEALVNLDDATGHVVLNNIEMREPFVYDFYGDGIYPNQRGDVTFDEAVSSARNYIEDVETDPSGRSMQFIGTTYPTARGGNPKNYREFRLLPPENDPRFANIDTTQHFERDTFAHFRSTDRAIERENGNIIDSMFVEEMQSDYVQGGQRAGFKPKNVTRVEAQNKAEELQTKFVETYTDSISDRVDRFLADTNLQGLEYQGKPIGTWIVDDLLRNIAENGSAITSNNLDFIRQDSLRNNVPVPPVLSDSTLSQLKDSKDLQKLRQYVRSITKKITDQVGEQQKFGEMLFDIVAGFAEKDVQQLAAAQKLFDRTVKGVEDLPMRSNWVELTMKSAIAQAVKENKQIIAFPFSDATISDVEGFRTPRGAISRLYLKDVPKILKKLAKQYDGTIETGKLTDSKSPNTRGEDSGKVIMLRLNNPDKIKKEGLALPSIVGATVAGAGAMKTGARPEEQQAENRL
tara:strand:- start:3497 stop:6631 length:3135 start_codon:yes stop_codon:yes gene_type:complete